KRPAGLEGYPLFEDRPMSWFLSLLEYVQGALTWLFSYPLLPLQLLLFFLLAWGRLAYDLGADDLFWSEYVGEQIVAGLGCALLFGEALLVRYLLDPNRDSFSFGLSLFPGTAPEISKLGQFLFLFWLPSLLLLAGPKLLSHDVWAGHVRA